MNQLKHTAGFSLIEVMVSLVILLIGLLGFAALQARASTAELESYQRVQALILMQDIADRLNANRAVAECYVTSSYVGTGYSGTPSCGSGSLAQQNLAASDVAEWNSLLQGAAEVDANTNSSVGAMVGARGCVSFDAGTNLYTITVVWQGRTPTAAPSAGLTCGAGLYGAETNRRAVSTIVSIANLT